MKSRTLNHIKSAVALLGIAWLNVMIGSAAFARATVANPLSVEALQEIRFDQKLNQQISLDAAFRDEEGRLVRLRDYRRPFLLVLGYHRCPMLCSLVLNGLVETLQDLKWTVGFEFDVVNISIDPHETPASASVQKQKYLRRYGRPASESGWHFLTGQQSDIQQLAQEVGFRYAYDSPSKEYAHPSGFVVLTPEGKVSQYFLGVQYASKELSAALRKATSHQISSPVQQLVLLCFHFNPTTGKYSPLIMTIVRSSGVLIFVLVAILIVSATRRRSAATPYAAAKEEEKS